MEKEYYSGYANWGGYQELEIRSLQIRGCIFSGSPISIAF